MCYRLNTVLIMTKHRLADHQTTDTGPTAKLITHSEHRFHMVILMVKRYAILTQVSELCVYFSISLLHTHTHTHTHTNTDTRTDTAPHTHAHAHALKLTHSHTHTLTHTHTHTHTRELKSCV